MSETAHSLPQTFAVLDPRLRLTPVAVTPQLYADLDRDFDDFRGHALIAEYAFERDWPTWECHPAGDELVLLLAGRARMCLRAIDGEREIALTEPGAYVIVPAGIWHTARIDVPTRMLFITPGEGTENRERPP